MGLKRSLIKYLAENGFTIQGLSMHVTCKVEKFKEGQKTPYEVLESHHNKFLVTGMNELFHLVIGSSANHFSEAKSEIGVGTDATAEDEVQTDLIGTPSYKAMDTGFPTHAVDKQAIFKSIFGISDGNQSWQEFVIKQTDSSVCLVRIVADKGTKSSGETWTVTITCILANP
jgi:hypothetical protein